MRIDFQDSGQTQPAVMPAQTQMRNASSSKRPILAILFLIAIVAAAAFGTYFFSRTGTIYTYGLVTAEFTPYYAPFEGTINGLVLERGQRVAKGEVLFTLSPVQSETVRAAQDQLLDEIDRLTEEASTKQQNFIEQARREVERLQAAYDQEVTSRHSAVEASRVESAKLKNVYDQMKRKADKVESLYNLDAAVLSDVEAAKGTADVAYHNWKHADLDLKLAQDRDAVSDAALQKAQLELERIVQESGFDPASLERGRVKLSVAQTRPDDLEVLSLFEGIVLEVGATNGSRVEEGRVVTYLAGQENIWVETYVHEKMARDIKPGNNAQIYLPGVEQPIQGIISNESAHAVRVPELLRDNLPGLQTGIYVRIKLDLTEEQPVVPGGQVRVVIPITAGNPIANLFK